MRGRPRRFTRSYLHHLFRFDSTGPQLVSYHNIAYMMRLTRGMRAAIIAGTYPEFVREFLATMFPAGDVPVGVVNALREAGIAVDTTLTEDAPAAVDAVDGDADA